MPIKEVEIFISSGPYSGDLRPIWPEQGEPLKRNDLPPGDHEKRTAWREETVEIRGASLHYLPPTEENPCTVTLYYEEGGERRRKEFPIDDLKPDGAHQAMAAWARELFGEREGKERVVISYS